ncbi:MAG TPA: response regulator transcription factor [Candidatus Sulfotelmatobacter sp.]|jgi:DNA-binding NarL/FixJ family response regulator
MPHAILIVDDSALIRHSIRDCIERNTDWLVCGEAENGEAAIEKVRQLRPDVVIIDWQMPVMNGLDAAREINRIHPGATLLMITLHESTELIATAHAVGVKEVLSKTDAVADHLLASLRNVSSGELKRDRGETSGVRDYF